MDTYKVTGTTPSGTAAEWIGVKEKDLNKFRVYLGDSYQAIKEIITDLDIDAIVNEVIEAAVELGLPRKPATFKRRFQWTVNRGRRSHGGMDWETNRPVIDIAPGWVNGQRTHLGEYARIAADPEIGSIGGCPIIATRALVCHEVAHALDFWNWHCGKHRDRRPIPHGSEWRFLYRQLRRHFGLTRNGSRG